MKKYLLILLFAISARSADLIWDDPNPAGIVTGYKVWSAQSDGTWLLVSTVTTNRWKIVLPVGEHKIAVSAIGGTNSIESDRSDAKIFTILIQPSIPRIEQ